MLATIIEKILFRRALEHKLEGYTLETSVEIAEEVAAAWKCPDCGEVWTEHYCG